MLANPVEKLRRIWTPQREVEEYFENLAPGTELDSMIRDLLHRVIQQKGPVTVQLESNGNPVMNTGTLRWEIIHYEPVPGMPIRKEASIWVEE